MSIIRAKRTQNFTIINNKVYERHVLSWQAMGMLGYLLSKPDDWRVVVPELVNVTKDTKKQTGREGVYNILKELEEKGYLTRKKNKDGTVDSFIFDEPKTVGLESARPNEARPNEAQPDVLIRTERQQELNNKNNYFVAAEACAAAPDDKPAEKTTAKRRAKNRDADDLALLTEYGVSVQTAEDYLTIRKAKRLPLTKTALLQIQAEANKAGLTVEQALAYAIGNGWASFRAEWLQNRMGNAAKTNEPSHRRFADKTTTPATTPAATLGMRPLGKM